jgi:hypothetical protein
VNFSPESQARIERLAAEMIVDELRKTVDFEELVTLPLSTVAHIIGLSPKQAGRVLPTRPMGTRNRGVSLKALKEYQNRGQTPPAP